MLKNETEYADRGKDYYEKQYRNRVTKNLKKRAASLGYLLVPNINQDGKIKDVVISTS